LFIAIVKAEASHHQASLGASEIIAGLRALEQHIKVAIKVATCQTMLLAGCHQLAD